VNVSTNRIGLAFHGTQLNAWTIRSSLFVENDIGVLFDLGKGIAQGVSFTDGTHFEDNKRAGVLFQTGDVMEVQISNGYAELFAGQRLVELRGKGPVPIRLRGFHYQSGFIYAKDTPPFYFETGPQDLARANIRGLYYNSSTAGLRAATFDGANTIGIIEQPTATSPSEMKANPGIVNQNGADVRLGPGAQSGH
jgi:hypothetical protein